MKETERLLDQMTRAYEGEAWHGPSLMEALVDVSAEEAAAYPLPQVHTIWEIILHLTAWEDAACRRLAGEPARLTDEQDWPPVTDPSPAGWQKALAALKAGHLRLREAVARLDDADLDRLSPPGEAYSFYVLLHGIVQHNLYHAGQIILLKKTLRT